MPPVCLCMCDMLCGAADLGLAILIAFCCHVVSNIACNCTASLYVSVQLCRVCGDLSVAEPNQISQLRFLQNCVAQTLRKTFTADGSTRSTKASRAMQGFCQELAGCNDATLACSSLQQASRQAGRSLSDYWCYICSKDTEPDCYHAKATLILLLQACHAEMISAMRLCSQKCHRPRWAGSSVRSFTLPVCSGRKQPLTLRMQLQTHVGSRYWRR